MKHVQCRNYEAGPSRFGILDLIVLPVTGPTRGHLGDALRDLTVSLENVLRREGYRPYAVSVSEGYSKRSSVRRF